MYGVHDKKLGYDFVGLVLEYNEETQIVTLQQRNYFKPGDIVEFFGPEIENVEVVIKEILDEKDKCWMRRDIHYKLSNLNVRKNYIQII